MEGIKPNEKVYTTFGYGVVVEMKNENKNEGNITELGLYRGESKIVETEVEGTEEIMDEEEIIEVEFSWGGRGYMQVEP